MKTLALRIFALVNAMVLALPPGWCASICQPQTNQPQTAHATTMKVSCCHRVQSETKSESTNLPLQPNVQCSCCVREATVPEKSLPMPDLQSLPLPVAADDIASLLGTRPTYEAAFVPIDMGLRLHVLLCVWRC